MRTPIRIEHAVQIALGRANSPQVYYHCTESENRELVPPPQSTLKMVLIVHRKMLHTYKKMDTVNPTSEAQLN